MRKVRQALDCAGARRFGGSDRVVRETCRVVRGRCGLEGRAPGAGADDATGSVSTGTLYMATMKTLYAVTADFMPPSKRRYATFF